MAHAVALDVEVRGVERTDADDERHQFGDLDAFMARARAFSPYTRLANMTGQPSMSVPLWWNAENLPIGAMFTARFGDEAMLFSLAAQLEEARPWFDRRPETG